MIYQILFKDQQCHLRCKKLVLKNENILNTPSKALSMKVISHRILPVTYPKTF